ncbi:hypothetical protein [Nonomuraea rubra]|uniref:Uncharacterized protein n=1 Tax=Nonomuraea rubra TaxID=46180 RepID=A0A7X0NPA9_9ACTN|nr:hypothetical protein [Nonomuraea rubra]MBB6547122.1 hypothetical protein [Nonomuraea rubra]
MHADAKRAAGDVVARYRALAGQPDAVVVVGTDYTDVGAPTEFEVNAPAGRGSRSARGQRGERADQNALADRRRDRVVLARHHARGLAVVVTRAAPGRS